MALAAEIRLARQTRSEGEALRPRRSVRDRRVARPLVLPLPRRRARVYAALLTPDARVCAALPRGVPVRAAPLPGVRVRAAQLPASRAPVVQQPGVLVRAVQLRASRA